MYSVLCRPHNREHNSELAAFVENFVLRLRDNTDWARSDQALYVYEMINLTKYLIYFSFFALDKLLLLTGSLLAGLDNLAVMLETDNNTTRKGLISVHD